MANDNLSVLYADDNPFDVELFRQACLEIGLDYQIDVVRDGQEVMDYLWRKGRYTSRSEERQPAAILLDVKMPKLNGIEALKLIRAEPDMQRIPIIMITSSEVLRDIDACYRSGANAYVVKPIDFDEFVSMMGAVSRFWVYLNKF